MLSLLVGFGKSYVGYWNVELHFPLRTILKQMALQNVFIVVLSRFYVVTVLVLRIRGVLCWHSVSLHLTLLFRMQCRVCLSRWFMGLYLECHLTAR